MIPKLETGFGKIVPNKQINNEPDSVKLGRTAESVNMSTEACHGD
ncbi:hypothetical protein SAMN05444158_0199 [Bradyrhizobium canariense]|uniref:Uncharacterized protein n=1 Tax=Bradyrhizobium canariense TaxID=255045 RepID=A0A1H1MEV7_9BRAD|nr:hypothetical protein SAMN05444158_0199 [Bradyrhizobium canariense]